MMNIAVDWFILFLTSMCLSPSYFDLFFLSPETPETRHRLLDKWWVVKVKALMEQHYYETLDYQKISIIMRNNNMIETTWSKSMKAFLFWKQMILFDVTWIVGDGRIAVSSRLFFI